nr:FAD-dependent oxidoreductase [Streptomyces sp. DSM 41633]
PNGLAAAITLASAGLDVTVLEADDAIGGGVRSSSRSLVDGFPDGLVVDHCSAIHPMAVGSAFLNGLGLERHGLQWKWPEVDCAHPLDDGAAGLLYRSVDDTAAALGADGGRWRRAFGGPSAKFDTLSQDIMGPL